MFFLRDIKIRYRQVLVGLLWVLLQPTWAWHLSWYLLVGRCQTNRGYIKLCLDRDYCLSWDVGLAVRGHVAARCNGITRELQARNYEDRFPTATLAAIEYPLRRI